MNRTKEIAKLVALGISLVLGSLALYLPWKAGLYHSEYSANLEVSLRPTVKLTRWREEEGHQTMWPSLSPCRKAGCGCH